MLEKVQSGLDRIPGAMGVRCQTAEHPFGTIKSWMVGLNVLAYNMKRVIAIVGVSALLAAMTTT